MNLFDLFLYGVVSGLVGVIACGVLIYRRRDLAACVCGLIFFGGPLLTLGVLEFRASQEQKEFELARKEVQEMCAKSGRDKIFRTVENVEGVFQMKARDPDWTRPMRDQFGMADPWGIAMGDWDDKPIPLATRGTGYFFVEQQPGFGQPEGPPFRRTYLKDTGRKVGETRPGADHKDDPELDVKEIPVQKLRSRYGYQFEDLTTREMREKWIAGGKIRIVDLETKEILAERTGFFRAVGLGARERWSGASAQQNGRMCPDFGGLGSFLLTVLKPIQDVPTSEQLKVLERD